MYGRAESCETVRRERDDLRSEVETMREDRERRLRQDREERERQRADSRRRANPSNRLYNGEVEDFQEATKLHAAACQQEMTSPAPDDSEDMRRAIESCNRTMGESIAKALRASSIHHQITSETQKRIGEALRAEGLDDWATCLESGDYSGMAI